MRPLILALSACALCVSVTATAKDWVTANRAKILEEFSDLVAIPNVASDTVNIRRNAEALVRMMKERKLSPRLLEGPVPTAPPAVYGEWTVPGATRTLVLYAHYDGQPVTAEKWKSTQPFAPKLFSDRLDRGGTPISEEARKELDPDWRLYGRSASDDKAGVMAILSAIDWLQAEGERPTYNVKIFFEGEEEAGSKYLTQILSANSDLLKSDGWLIFDGAANQSGVKQVVLGVRGIVGVDITVYGALRPLHSGVYGNWAPNPAMHLAQLLASMKDKEGRVIIDGFYDDVIPITPAEQKAIAAVPNSDAQLKTDLGLGWTEGGGRPVAETTLEPSLNIDGLRSADVKEHARNIIPATATATIDMRLVAGNDHQRQFEKLVRHIRAQGFHVVDHEPKLEERLAHERIAYVEKKGGYNAERTPLSHPLALDVIHAVRSIKSDAIIVPSLGGSLPLYKFKETLGAPSIGIALANHDNNQHAEDENLRLSNLWDAIEIARTVMTMRSEDIVDAP